MLNTYFLTKYTFKGISTLNIQEVTNFFLLLISVIIFDLMEIMKFCGDGIEI